MTLEEIRIFNREETRRLNKKEGGLVSSAATWLLGAGLVLALTPEIWAGSAALLTSELTGISSRVSNYLGQGSKLGTLAQRGALDFVTFVAGYEIGEKLLPLADHYLIRRNSSYK